MPRAPSGTPRRPVPHFLTLKPLASHLRATICGRARGSPTCRPMQYELFFCRLRQTLIRYELIYTGCPKKWERSVLFILKRVLLNRVRKLPERFTKFQARCAVCPLWTPMISAFVNKTFWKLGQLNYFFGRVGVWCSGEEIWLSGRPPYMHSIKIVHIIYIFVLKIKKRTSHRQWPKTILSSRADTYTL